jgi:hypothetical protein
MNKPNVKALAFTKTALAAAALAWVGATGLQADEVIQGTSKDKNTYQSAKLDGAEVNVREFKDGKELEGEERLRIPHGLILRFTGDKTTVDRAIEPQANGRRGHGVGYIEVVKPDAVLTLTSVHGNNEPGVYRRTHKIGAGTLVIGGEEDNDGAKFVVWEGKVIFAKVSDGGTHAQGNTGYLEIYSSPQADIDAGKPDRIGTVVLAGKGGDQIADEANVLIGGVHSDRGGVLDLNTNTETVGSLVVQSGTLRYAFGGAVGKTGTLTVEGEKAVEAKGKSTIDITDGDKWLPGSYTLIKASEDFEDATLAAFTLKGVKKGKLVLSPNKKSLILEIAK